MIKISDYKNKKRLKIIINDLKNLKQEMVKCLQILEVYKKYTPASSSITNIQDNILNIKIHLDKCEKFIQ